MGGKDQVSTTIANSLNWRRNDVRTNMDRKGSGEGEVMAGLFVLLLFTVLACIFMLCWAVRDTILDLRKKKHARIIKEKGYLPIEMEKR